MEPYNPPIDPWLHVLYQDQHIIVVNKPSGLLSVPGRAPEHHDSTMSRIQRDFPHAEAVHRSCIQHIEYTTPSRMRTSSQMLGDVYRFHIGMCVIVQWLLQCQTVRLAFLE